MTLVTTMNSSIPLNEVATSSKPFVEVKSLTAGYGELEILHSLTFEMMAGQTLVILGESGCGKTTLLRVLTGLIPYTSGEIHLDSKLISERPANDHAVIYLDQEPLLFEHLTVAENIAFALRLRRRPANEVNQAVVQLLDAIDLSSHANKREWQLSGGQKQRVAFARAILAHPRLLLLDEPFCSLDSRSRGQMQELFSRLSIQYALTSIFVTHDVKEALMIGNRFARMTDGRLLLYPDRNAFMNDPATGVSAEIAFWQQSAKLLN